MAKIKISDLAAAGTLDGSEEIPVVQGGETVKTTAQDIADLGGGGSSYLKYVALLSQTGTDAPVATVLENTLGGTVVWYRDDTGQYSAILSGVFTINKTWISVFASEAGAYTYSALANDADSIILFRRDATFVGEDVFSNISIEIRVYP